MEKDVVVIGLNRYDNLLSAECAVKAIKAIAENDKGVYGYAVNTSNAIDAILGIKRNEE
jgi:hypothetical protein